MELHKWVCNKCGEEQQDCSCKSTKCEHCYIKEAVHFMYGVNEKWCDKCYRKYLMKWG